MDTAEHADLHSSDKHRETEFSFGVWSNIEILVRVTDWSLTSVSKTHYTVREMECIDADDVYCVVRWKKSDASSV